MSADTLKIWLRFVSLLAVKAQIDDGKGTGLLSDAHIVTHSLAAGVFVHHRLIVECRKGGCLGQYDALEQPPYIDWSQGLVQTFIVPNVIEVTTHCEFRKWNHSRWSGRSTRLS